MNDPRQTLILLARVREELYRLHEDGRLAEGELRRRIAELDRATAAPLRELPSMSLRELLSECRSAGLQFDDSPLRGQLRGETLALLRSRREQALADGETHLDLSDLEPGLSIPLIPFDWGVLRRRFENLLTTLRGPELSREDAVDACRKFFGMTDAAPRLPAQLPRISRSLFSRLLKARILHPDEPASLAPDVQRFEEALRDDFRSLKERAQAGEDLSERLADAWDDTAYRLLAARAAGPIDKNPDVVRAFDGDLIRWPGPGFFALAAAWQQAKSHETKAQRQRKADLIVARFGVDPIEERIRWTSESTRLAGEERGSQAELLRLIAKERDWYETALMLAAGEALGDDTTQRWWTIIESLRRGESPRVAEAAQAAEVVESEPATSAPPIEAAAATPASALSESATAPPEEDVLEEIVPEDEPEQLLAPAARISQEDRWVEQKSAWNTYLRPFLSDNWLGLLGISFLMAAWMFLTLWLWDKGQGVRLAMGVVPLLALTIGSAWISRFIAKLPDAAPRATALFASLSFFSVPFNLGLGASLLDLGGLGLLAGAAVAAVYAALIPWLGRRLEPSFQRNPSRFLAEASFLVYLPPIAGFVDAATFALTPLLFLSFVALARGLLRAKADGKFSRFVWMQQAGALLLANGISWAYYRETPSVGAFALLAQMIAWATIYFGRRSGTSIAVGGGVSVIGVLLATATPAFLPFVIAAAVVLWLGLRDALEQAWLDEVVTIHLLALAASVVWAIGAPLAAWPIAFAVACAIAVYLERRTTDALSWALPLLIAGAAWVARDASAFLKIVDLALIAGFFVFAWIRTARSWRAEIWSITVLATPALVAMALDLKADVERPGLALIAGATALLWTIALPFLRDAMSRRHGVAILWCFAGFSALLQFAYLLQTPLRPALAFAALATIVALLEAARRACSPWPTGVALALTALFVLHVRMLYGFSSSGLGITLGAAAVWLIAELIDRFSWDRRSDSEQRFWGLPFPHAGDRFFAFPCEVAGVVAWCAALGRVAVRFDAATAAPMTALAAGLLTVIAIRQAWRLDLSFAGWAAWLPLTLGVAMVTASLWEIEFKWMPHAVLLAVVATHFLHKSWRGRAPQGLLRPWESGVRWTSWIAVVFAFPLYVVTAIGVAGLETAAWFALAALFTHFFAVRHAGGLRTHLLWLHVAIAWLLASANLTGPWQPLGLTPIEQVWAIGFFLIVFCAGQFLERRREPWSSYARSAQLWLAASAFGYSVYAAVAAPDPSAAHAAIAWTMLLFANRILQWGFLLGVRGVLSLVLGAALFPGDPLGGALLGLFFFLASEVLMQRSEGPAGAWLQGAPLADHEPTARPLAITLLLQTVLVFTAHQVLVWQGDSPRHFWLFGLMPIVFLIERMSGVRAWRGVGLALFPWTLSFLAVDLQASAARFGLTPLHLIAAALVASMIVFRIAEERVGTRWHETLRRQCSSLGIGVMVLLGINFSLAHDLTGDRFRFLFSSVLLALVTGYFRFAVRDVGDLHRAAYRVAATLTFWSLGFALIPSPQAFLYLILLPAIFFAVRHEMKGGSHDDQIAAGILYGIAAALYFYQQPIRLVFFPDTTFDADAFLWNAPVLFLVGLGFIRLNRGSAWRGLAFLGTLFAGLGGVLTATLASRAAIAGFEQITRIPTEFLWALGIVHGWLAFLFAGRGASLAFDRFAGLDEDEAAAYRRQIWTAGVVVLHLIAGASLLRSDHPTALLLAFAAVPAWLWTKHRRTVSIALIEAALLFFPGGLLFPALSADLLCIGLTALLALCTTLRRTYRVSVPVPNETYALCAAIFVAALIHRGFFAPSTLIFLAVLAASWIFLPDRPGRLSVAQLPLLWPALAAVILLCLGRGYDPVFLSWWALISTALPAAAAALLFSPAGRRLSRRRSGGRLERVFAEAPRALEHLTWIGLAIAVAAFAVGYGQHRDGRLSVIVLIAALACNLLVHLFLMLDRRSALNGGFAEMYVWLMLALVRWKLEMLDILDLGTPIDGYAFLGAAFLTAGLREIIRRRTETYSKLLIWSGTIYGFIGWAWTMWLQFFSDASFGHGEIGSALMAGLYWWFAVSQRRTHLIPAFVFANVAAMLYCIRVGLHHPQFYVLPAMTTVLILAQMFKNEIEPRRLQSLRLGCGLVLLGTTTFYNVVDFEESMIYPLAAALISALAVVAGIALRVRVFLFLGFTSFAVNTLAVLIHVLRAQPESHEKLLLGAIFLVIGTIFTGSFLLLQWKRQEILRRYAMLREELAEWE